MTKLNLTFLLFLITAFSLSCQQEKDEFAGAFEFIAAADMRYYVADDLKDGQHFMGALRKIKELGGGTFMVSTGDIDPPSIVKDSINSVLGDDYIWYPVIGNHEIEGADYMTYLRELNKDGTSLPNIVRKGPAGCEETTFSFDWANCHFVALNQYYDGKSDIGTDGNIVPELMEWLREDLAATDKKFIFVMGHEPIFAMPDMDNGRIRHYDDCLNQYLETAVEFIQLMQEHNVTAYLCGHTHGTSFTSINGLWQLDTGHSRGLEGFTPDFIFEKILPELKKNESSGLSLKDAADKFYTDYIKPKDIRKALDYMDFTGGLTYKQVNKKQVVDGLVEFYNQAQKGPAAVDSLKDNFWKGAKYAASTFVKFYVGEKRIKAEIYRDDARGGAYNLRKTLFLE